MLMFDGLQIAMAWQMLHDPNVTQHLNADAYYDLCIKAGYTEEMSQKAARDWGNKRLAADVPV
jgi:hypothetical protein